ncbi:MAG: hypothetical protein IPQ13_12360 [Holophagaceae bacterium]|nr:hypothetical protein [Holophagaceae bacterium]
MTPAARFSLPFVLAALLVGCGSSAPEAVSLDPDPPTVQVGERLQLRATPNENLATEPEWELMDYNGGGLLSTKGLATTYLAPNHAGTFRLMIHAKRPDGSTAKVQREIRVLPIFKPEPATAMLQAGQVQTFTVKVRGLARNDVIWKAEAGTFSEGGTYIAPTEPGTYHLTATSASDPSVSATVTVIVN